MMEPSFDDIEKAYHAGSPVLLATRMVADLETPVSAYLKLSHAQPDQTFLLESVEGGTNRGRYSMIGLWPDVIFKTDGEAALINWHAQQDPHLFEPCAKPPLEALRALLRESALPKEAFTHPLGILPPMSAGIFGYLGYEMVRQMEHLPSAKPELLNIPDSWLIRPTMMVIFDSVRDDILVITPLRPQAGITARVAYEKGVERIERVVSLLEGSLPSSHFTESPDPYLHLPPITSNTTPQEFMEKVERAKAYIRAGDIFQVVLSQRFTTSFSLPPFALYRALRRVNPAPFLCYLDFGAFQIVCSSPEILVRVREGKVTIRPIAGTRPRGETYQKDLALAQDLLHDPKERAEHLMLLDLGRNDVGRVSQIHSVQVTEQFFIERYSHVMHIVSNVEGDLKEGCEALDALIAGFPAGTVSGAPKIRALEIIDELEKDRRDLYAGCIGYFGAAGEMDTCIVLRTAIVKDGYMHVQAGAGIVYDSDPLSEQNECLHKSRALFQAAEEAVRFATQGKHGQ